MKNSGIFFVCLIAVLVGGCQSSVQYLDKQTPAGVIPPPQPPALTQQSSTPPATKSLERTFESQTAASGPIGSYELDKNITRPAGSSQTGDLLSGTAKRFSAAYSAKGKPKIAIFLNRTLSDEVREWRNLGRIVIAGDGSISKRNETLTNVEESTVKGPLSIGAQTQMEIGGARINPAEGYMWSYEDGFMQPFLRAGAYLVDRATIMRLTSLEFDQKSTNDLAVKNVEMRSLVNKADIYVELLISAFPSSNFGYEFRAVVKEVKTGRIMASSTSLNWDKDKFSPKKIITTAAGYEISNKKDLPRLQDVTQELAIDVMNSLIITWDAAN